MSQFAENPFGVTGAGMVVGDTTDPNEPLNLLRAGNIGWIRLGIDWSVAGADSTHYDNQYLSHYDAVAARARQVGVHVCMGLSYAPDWTHPGYLGRRYAPYPSRYRVWTRFVTDMVRRYSALGVHCYSIWSEPNSSQSFAPVATSPSNWWSEYEALLLVASGVIRTVDPSARVVAYELSYVPSRKLERELAASLDRVGSAIDVVAVHYVALLPDDIYDAMVTRIPAVNPLIHRHGLELWLTEARAPAGWSPSDSVQMGAWVTTLMMGFSQRPDSSSWNKTFISSRCVDSSPGLVQSMVSDCPTLVSAQPRPAFEALRSIATRFVAAHQDH